MVCSTHCNTFALSPFENQRMNNDDNECSSISLSLFLDIVCIKAHLHYHACVWFYNEFDMINGTESFAHFQSVLSRITFDFADTIYIVFQ